MVTSEDARVFNTAPRPRMIIRGFHDNGDLVAELAALAPTYVHVTSLGEVNQNEWDVLVTDAPFDELYARGMGGRTMRTLEEHIFAVHRSRGASHHVIERGNWLEVVSKDYGHIRRELRRSVNVPSRVRPLVESFEPILRQRDSHEYFLLRPPRVGDIERQVDTLSTPPQIDPFVETADGRVLAGRYPRSGEAEAWLLPSDVPDLARWVEAALGEWHARAPRRFPALPDWSRHPTWASHRERELSAELRTLRDERDAHVAELAAREAALDADLAQAAKDADAYERRLLTAKDRPLVMAVMRALTEIGFTVTDADKRPGQRENLEDLEVHDPDEAGWVALVEVKGYSKGAQTGALTQFLRFERRYRQRTGRDPDALWYIANQFQDRDPGARPTILQAMTRTSAVARHVLVLPRFLCRGRTNNSPGRRRTEGGCSAAGPPGDKPSPRCRGVLTGE